LLAKRNISSETAGKCALRATLSQPQKKLVGANVPQVKAVDDGKTLEEKATFAQCPLMPRAESQPEKTFAEFFAGIRLMRLGFESRVWTVRE
jgi:hypothetical protein